MPPMFSVSICYMSSCSTGYLQHYLIQLYVLSYICFNEAYMSTCSLLECYTHHAHTDFNSTLQYLVCIMKHWFYLQIFFRTETKTATAWCNDKFNINVKHQLSATWTHLYLVIWFINGRLKMDKNLAINYLHHCCCSLQHKYRRRTDAFINSTIYSTVC